MRTEWMEPSAAAATASRPSSAPGGPMIRPRQQRARAQDHHLLAGEEHRAANLIKNLPRCTFDGEVGVLG
jgi:hypothetical protein